ncbi:SDR family oxidoreductase [Streptomyces sp. NPDC051132]|uniref:SDR family oxidoreductase n=1 Tax=Streptomyces sp. NPDC051132 TaxID=3155667 RepID=UPI00342DFD31
MARRRGRAGAASAAVSSAGSVTAAGSATSAATGSATTDEVSCAPFGAPVGARVAGFMYGFDPHPRLREEIASGVFDSEEFSAQWLRHALLQATDGVTVRPEDRRLFAVGLTPDGSQHLEHALVTAGVRGVFADAGTPLPDGLDVLYPLATDTPENLLPYRIARTAAHDLPESAEIVVVDTACSSSLYTIDLGARALRAGETDVALCGGALALQAQSLVLFSKLRGLSQSGSVRALDRDADGVLFSDGAAVLALKKYTRAVADGDDILGFVAGFGGSSDGRGKAIYAPNATGQRLALDRAWSAADAGPEDVDWIVAHATGTPTGDKTELTALTESAGPGKTWTMTSNKSLVGHSGWAAGAVSAVHALLALRHQVIPAQRQFDRLPDGFDGRIEVPTVQVPWPARPGRRRVVGVSAMGFGGTNGHLLLTDGHPGGGGAVPEAQTPATAEAEDPIVVVASAAHLPELPDAERVEAWLAGGAPTWPASFGDSYPLPSPVEARLAPSALAAMDRSQLMALRCADMISGDWVKDEQLSSRTGVFVGHTGPTHSAMGYDLRCYLADLEAKFTGPAGLPTSLLGDPVRAMVPRSNEDSYPGLMPNVIAARVVQRLDLHGPNMTLDAGPDSVHSALATAVRYLRDGELDLAIVMGISTVTPHLETPDGREAAEAAIGFLLTHRSTAESLGMEVLGSLTLVPARTGDAGAAEAMATGVADSRDYRSAQGAIALLQALHAPRGRTLLHPSGDDHTPGLLVTTGAPGTQDGPPPAAAAARPATGLAADSERHALVLRPVSGRRVRAAVEAVPPGCLVLTDDPQTLVSVPLPPDVLVVTHGPAPLASHVPFPVTYLDDAADLARVVADDGRRFGQVRVVVSGQRWCAPEQVVPQRVLDLDDLAFVAAQVCAEALDDGGCYAVLMLDVLDGAIPLPYAGLFGGVVRSLQQELTGCLVLALGTSLCAADAGLDRLAEESAFHRFLPVVYLVGGERCEQLLLPVGAPAPNAGIALPDHPVIVATGGARGLTAHLVHEVVAGCTPQSVWLLGTGPEPGLTSAEPPEPDRAQALRSLMARYPGRPIGELNQLYDRSLQDAERADTLRELEKTVGPGRVHYRQCDVLDADAVRRVVDEVLAAEGRADVVLHGAGLARTSMLARKKLADFRTVRDVKVRGYAHLRTALADRQPLLWASVSSVSAFTPLRGEFDYGAGNEFLTLAAAHGRAITGRDEVALASGLWVESGMASADTPGGAFLARQAEIGQLTDAQGREFFRTELAGRGSHGLATTWIGDNDWNTLQRRAPGFRDFCLATAAAEPQAPHRAPHRAERRVFLTGRPEADGSTAVWTVEIGLAGHPYLLEHLVDGRPTVPGTFILEMAAEAAAELAPGLLPARITDVVLSQFIRAAHHRWPRTLRVTATREDDRVRVRITSPAAGPVPEREHTRMVVHLARSLQTGPWCPPAPAGGGAGPNTYELPGTPIELSGVFRSLREPRLEPDGGSAELRLTLPTGGAPYAAFLLPSVTLDCLLRTSVLDGRRPDAVGAMVPTALAAIDLYTAANDVELAEAWPGGLRLRHWYDPVSGRQQCAVVTPDGRALIQASGITGTDKSVYDVRSGSWRS